jgi:hypothetical protein
MHECIGNELKAFKTQIRALKIDIKLSTLSTKLSTGEEEMEMILLE